MHFFCIFVICAAFTCVLLRANPLNPVGIKPGPRFPPTKGSVWPSPQFERREDTYYLYKQSQFQFNITFNTCDILTKAVQRYSFILKTYQHIARWTRRLQLERNSHRRFFAYVRKMDNPLTITELEIDLTSPCEEYPYLRMDESYKLSVNERSYLSSNSIWGVLRGLESFSHMFYLSDDYTEVRINKTEILDFPRYKHRGLLLDTSRHFISLHHILKTLNAMSMNKMNVFHWHIVDDESFPYQSEKFPDLSAKGAYHELMVYTKEDIQTVIAYARDRGIRVVPEFDVPGHTRSWGEAYPDILTQCYKGNVSTGLGPMDPTNLNTYTLLRPFFLEVQDLFPDKYFHVGGDEVDLGCWSSNPQLQDYMKQHNVSEKQLHGIFMETVIRLLKKETSAIVWQEVFDEGVPLDKDILVQVWKSNPALEMAKVLRSGHKVLFSSSWYLDHLQSGGDWTDFYEADPRNMVEKIVTNADLQNIVGGEACMWGEVVDDTNVISRVWPRASAVAERLWSADLLSSDLTLEEMKKETSLRLEEHTCRMNRRGVAAQPPNGPGVCVTYTF